MLSNRRHYEETKILKELPKKEDGKKDLLFFPSTLPMTEFKDIVGQKKISGLLSSLLFLYEARMIRDRTTKEKKLKWLTFVLIYTGFDTIEGSCKKTQRSPYGQLPVEIKVLQGS